LFTSCMFYYFKHYGVYLIKCKSRDGWMVQHWATGCMIGGLSPGRGWEFFSSPPCPDRLWGPPIRLPSV
jgi:hypothetical protein